MLTIQFIAFFSYIFFVYKKIGVQPSISHSFYRLPQRDKWLFTIMLFVIGIGQVLQTEKSVLFFLSGSGLCFTGVATSFLDDKMTKTVHFTGTVLGIVGSCLAFLISYSIFIPSVILISLIPAIFKIKNGLWWYEITAFITIFITMFFIL